MFTAFISKRGNSIHEPTANKRKISACRQYPHNIKPRHDATIDNQRHIFANRSANG